MPRVWYTIAEKLATGCGTFICNVVLVLRRDEQISAEELDEVLRAVAEEHDRQVANGHRCRCLPEGTCALWADLNELTDGKVARIRFCTARIREVSSR